MSKKGYASITQFYDDFKRKIDYGCKLLMEACNDDTLTVELLLSKDTRWIEPISSTNPNINMSVSCLRPYTSLFHMLAKGGAIKYIPEALLQQISINALLEPLGRVSDERNDKNLLSVMASTYCIKDLPEQILKLITADIVSKNVGINLLSYGDVEALHPEISGLKLAGDIELSCNNDGS